MGRRKRGDKAKAQEKHAIRRLRERFGIELKQHEYDHLCAQIRRGEEWFYIGKETCRLTHYAMTIEGKAMAAVYDKQRHKIVTFLPMEWSHERINETRREKCKYVVLQGIKHGNRFYSSNDPDSDPRLSAEGEVWYDVLGYVNTPAEALKIINTAWIAQGGLDATRRVREQVCVEGMPEDTADDPCSVGDLR